MDLSETFRIWRRRRLLTVLLLILALVGGVAALIGLPRAYQSDSSVILLPSRSAARQNGGNPYLSFTPSLTLTAEALSQELMGPGVTQDLIARGFPSPYTVALAPDTTTTTGSVLLVTVTGSNKNLVEGTLTAVTGEIGTKLLQLQGKVTAPNRIRALTLSSSPYATLNVSQTARPLVTIAVLELLLALGIPVLVDARVTRRRLRRRARAVLLEGGTEPASRLPSGTLPSGTLRTLRG